MISLTDFCPEPKLSNFFEALPIFDPRLSSGLELALSKNSGPCETLEWFFLGIIQSVGSDRRYEIQ